MTIDPNNPVVLARFPSEFEAAVLVTALAARGIEAMTTGAFTSGFRAEAPGDINVIVRLESLPLAQQILSELDQDPGDVDWSQVDVGDPDDS